MAGREESHYAVGGTKSQGMYTTGGRARNRVDRGRVSGAGARGHYTAGQGQADVGLGSGGRTQAHSQVGGTHRDASAMADAALEHTTMTGAARADHHYSVSSRVARGGAGGQVGADNATDVTSHYSVPGARERGRRPGDAGYTVGSSRPSHAHVGGDGGVDGRTQRVPGSERDGSEGDASRGSKEEKSGPQKQREKEKKSESKWPGGPPLPFPGAVHSSHRSPFGSASVAAPSAPPKARESGSQGGGRQAEQADADDSPPRPGRIVAAIDIGTSRIAAVYTHVPRDEHDKRGVCYFAVGSAEGKEVAAVLLKLRDPSLTHISRSEDVQLCQFGEEAVRKHKELTLNPDGQDYLLCSSFKMNLLDKNEDVAWEEACGPWVAIDKREVRLQVIVVELMRAMKEQLLQRLSKHGETRFDDMVWVLTVPAIWSHKAKSFMRRCGYEAGLVPRSEPHRILIAVEPEGVCFSAHFEGGIEPALEVERRYIVVDGGGGTVDLSCMKVSSLSPLLLRKVGIAKGKANGCAMVDAEFSNLLTRIFGDSWTSCTPIERMEVMDMWEQAKQNMADVDEDISVIMSFDGAEAEQVERYNEGREESVHLTFDDFDGQLTIPSAVVAELFEPSLQSVEASLREYITDYGRVQAVTVLMAGGYALCPLFQERVRRCASSLGVRDVLLLGNAPVAVVHGAALFGCAPQHVVSRVMDHTIGMIVGEVLNGSCPVQAPYVANAQHWRKRGIIYRSTPTSRHERIQVLEPIVARGTTKGYKEVTYFDWAVSTGQTVLLELATCDAEEQSNPLIATEDNGVRVLGEIRVTKPSGCGRLFVKFYFGTTELHVCVFDADPRKDSTAKELTSVDIMYQ